jgi:hypothetical protein
MKEPRAVGELVEHPHRDAIVVGTRRGHGGLPVRRVGTRGADRQARERASVLVLGMSRATEPPPLRRA